jgi:hypothetical protein
VLAGAKEDRADRDVHLVDKPGLEVLPDRRDTTAEANILTVGCVGRPLQRGMDSVRDEVKGCSAVHGDWWPGVIGEHEDRRVVRRVVAPPPLPGVVGPGSADRSEHVAAEDPRSDVCETARHEVVVDPAHTAIFALHLLKGARGDYPIVQSETADTERVVEVLLGTAP